MTGHSSNNINGLPSSKEEVAAAGLRAAIKLAAKVDGESIEQAEVRLSNFLQCNLHQLRFYARKAGLPLHYTKQTLEYMKMRDVPIGRHQLQPTKAVLHAYGID